MSLEQLQDIRERLLPMLRFAAGEYEHRVPAGYPVVIDQIELGQIGIELDASHSLYIVSDGADLFATLSTRASRIDARSSASRPKFSGAPVNDSRPLSGGVDQQTLRNLLAELFAAWNTQPNLIFITDT
ncbi:MAG: hypothetical protein M3R06_06300 [Chloroflexota bacterium]|nr:hypothetical protein [Chloroflexota bacterium]